MHPVYSIAITLACLTFILLGSAKATSCGMLSGELARKTVHVGMGLLCLGFPWLFDSVLAVQILAAVAVLALLLVRLSKLRRSVGTALFSVQRLSIGELLFPVAVAWLFTLGWDQPVLYAVSLLLLTLADTAGALAGSRFGKKIYHTTAATKSLEGSLAFLATAFICVSVPLYFFTALSPGMVLVLAFTVSLFSMAVEGASGHGLDNLLIPIGAFLLLDYYTGLTGADLVLRLVALIVLLLLLIGTRKQHTLDGGAVLTAMLFGFAAFTLGGVPCLAAALILFVRHILTQRLMPDNRVVTHSLASIIAIGVPSLFWLTIGRGGVITHTQGQLGSICTLALLMAMLHSGVHKHLGRKSASLPVGFMLSLLALCPVFWLEIKPVSLTATLVLAPVSAWLYFHWRSGTESSPEITADNAFKLGVLAAVFSPLAMLPVL